MSSSITGIITATAAGTPGPSLAHLARTPFQTTRYQEIIDSIAQGFHVCGIGIVQSFSPGPPATVSVQLVTRELVQMNAVPFGEQPVQIVTKALDIPPLTDVPIQIPTGGGWNITLPIKEGDECAVLFSDSCIDGWFQSGGTQNIPLSTRRHDLSDAIAIFGVRSTPTGLESYSSNSMELRNDDGTTKITLADGQITINAQTVNVTAETVNVTGSNQVVISGNGQTKIEDRLFLQHEHLLTSGTTGPVV